MLKTILGMWTMSFTLVPLRILAVIRFEDIETIVNRVPLQRPCLGHRFLSSMMGVSILRFNLCGGVPDGCSVLRNSSGTLGCVHVSTLSKVYVRSVGLNFDKSMSLISATVEFFEHKIAASSPTCSMSLPNVDVIMSSSVSEIIWGGSSIRLCSSSSEALFPIFFRMSAQVWDSVSSRIFCVKDKCTIVVNRCELRRLAFTMSALFPW